VQISRRLVLIFIRLLKLQIPLLPISQITPNLTKLDIGGNFGYENSYDFQYANLSPIATKCPKLMFLNLSFFKKVSTRAILEILAGCKALRHLNLASTELNKDYENPPTFSNNTFSLTFLNLFLTNKKEAKQLQDLIVPHSPYMERLYVDAIKTPFVTDMPKFFKNITHLHIKSIHISDNDLSVIAHSYSNLKVFCLYATTNITDTGVTPLLTCCTKLHVFSIAADITDLSIKLLAANGKDLRAIALCNAVIHDDTVDSIRKSCTQLKYLELRNCKEVTQPMIERLTEIYKKAKDKLLWSDILRGVEPNWESFNKEPATTI